MDCGLLPEAVLLKGQSAISTLLALQQATTDWAVAMEFGNIPAEREDSRAAANLSNDCLGSVN